MTLFFDRNIGTALPRARQLLKPPLPIEYHNLRLAMDTEARPFVFRIQRDNRLRRVGLR